MNEPLIIYIVVQPFDYSSAEVQAFRDKEDAEEHAAQLRQDNRNGQYVTIQERII